MTDQGETILRGRLSGQQRVRLNSLLNMMYTPREIADTVGFNVRQFYRVYIPFGCPHEKDERGRLWIHGESFRDWYLTLYTKAQLADHEAYCLTCKKPVPIIDGIERQQDILIFLESYCPNCGRKLARIVRQERGNRDQSG